MFNVVVSTVVEEQRIVGFSSRAEADNAMARFEHDHDLSPVFDWVPVQRCRTTGELLVVELEVS